MKLFLIRFFANILGSLFLTFLVFIGSYSWITGEFPPRWGQMLKGLQRLKDFQSKAQTLARTVPSSGDFSESDLEELKRLRAQGLRAQNLLYGQGAEELAKEPTGQNSGGSRSPEASTQLSVRLTNLEITVMKMKSDLDSLVDASRQRSSKDR